MDPNYLLSSLNLDCKGLKQLYDTQSLVDCTLACDGGKVSAHKVVLSACSNYLAKILLEHPVEHPIIILPELSIEDVKTLVHYMYTGELLKLNTQHSNSLLRTAAILSVNSLNDFLSGNTLNGLHNNYFAGNQATIDAGNVSNVVNNHNNNNNNNSLNNSISSTIISDAEGIISTSNLSGTNLTSNNIINTANKSEFQFKCPVCQNDFQTICSFEYHMQRIHNVTSFGCEICHKPFASLRYVLTDHMRRCHGWKAEQKLQC